MGYSNFFVFCIKEMIHYFEMHPEYQYIKINFFVVPKGISLPEWIDSFVSNYCKVFKIKDFGLLLEAVTYFYMENRTPSFLLFYEFLQSHPKYHSITPYFLWLLNEKTSEYFLFSTTGKALSSVCTSEITILDISDIDKRFADFLFFMLRDYSTLSSKQYETSHHRVIYEDFFIVLINPQKIYKTRSNKEKQNLSKLKKPVGFPKTKKKPYDINVKKEFSNVLGEGDGKEDTRSVMDGENHLLEKEPKNPLVPVSFDFPIELPNQESNKKKTKKLSPKKREEFEELLKTNEDCHTFIFLDDTPLK